MRQEAATTPDLEKIAWEIKDLFARHGSGEYMPTSNEVGIIDEALLRLLAQAREPLVKALEACDPAHIWDIARQHFTGDNVPICDVLTEHRDKLIEIRRAALTDTEENLPIDQSLTP